MKKIFILAIFTVAVCGYTVPQIYCPQGQHQVVIYEINGTSYNDMPITKCEKNVKKK